MFEITDYINNDIPALDLQCQISKVQDFFAEHFFTHFPVVDKGVYIGALNAEDAETFDPGKKISDYRYTLDVFFARSSMTWMDVMEVFAQNQTDIAPVLNEKNEYAGFYLLSEVVKFFSETPFLKEQGGIIIVQKPLKDYSISQVSQIVESNNCKILGLFISHADLENVQITIKITLGGMNEIIQTFRRYNYDIISSHDEDSYLLNLKERSEYLDKYLNI